MTKNNRFEFDLALYIAIALLIFATLLMVAANAQSSPTGPAVNAFGHVRSSEIDFGRYGTDNTAAIETSGPEVRIDNFRFLAGAVTVPRGTTVTWINRDDAQHQIVASDSSFKSHVLEANQKFSYTFDNAGTFAYSCSIHPSMTGKVVVQ